jgi:hypothetical protein
MPGNPPPQFSQIFREAFDHPVVNVIGDLACPGKTLQDMSFNDGLRCLRLSRFARV